MLQDDEMLVKVKQVKLKRDDPKFTALADKITQVPIPMIQLTILSIAVTASPF